MSISLREIRTQPAIDNRQIVQNNDSVSILPWTFCKLFVCISISLKYEPLVVIDSEQIIILGLPYTLQINNNM